MPRWTPVKEWLDSDVYIIGGGPSLRGFNFELLRGKRTIGCNSAYTLGADLCNICFFSDMKWFERFKSDLEQYKGRVFTHNRQLAAADVRNKIPWLNWMPRGGFGLHHDQLCFGASSGAGAINLALVLGAKRVFLLGFDCKHYVATQPNWHNQSIQKPIPGAYARFVRGFLYVRHDLPIKFPGCSVINLGPDSELKMFPKAHYSEYLHEDIARAS